jgi:hypothetical protein
MHAMSARSVRCAAVVAAMLSVAATAAAQTAFSGETYRIARAPGPIVIDGDLSDPGWRDATRLDHWFEISPGDNTEPKVLSVGYLTYDDKYFYAGFEFSDPNPRAINAPFGDHDFMPSTADFGGMFLDTRHDGHTAFEFEVSAHNIQFDAIMDDGAGENASPDFFWQSAARITDRGWTLEIRVPFSSLRYTHADPQTWGIMLFRNYPRRLRYEYMTTKQPRGSQCFVCREGDLQGLEKLPAGRHVVVAPYVFANDTAHPAGDPGTALVNGPVDAKAGLDAKWEPNADNVIDGTVKPDFSQVESDTAQIVTNKAFALFYSEKRPFFLEGVELFNTPMQAVYTRTITAPKWGARATGKADGFNYTALVANDAGGGSAVLPGPVSSSFATQDFSSMVFVGRARRDVSRSGQSFVSVLVTDRESGSDGHNRVVGPDFQWRPSSANTFAGQWLVSETTTPNRPDVAAAWTGASFTSSAGQLQWSHNTVHFDASATYKDIGAGFRANTGFMPQVGYRDTSAQTGWTIHPTGFVNQARFFLQADRQTERDGSLIFHQISPGVGLNTRWNGFLLLSYEDDRVRAADTTFPRQQFQLTASISPSRRFAQLGVNGYVGTDADLTNLRPGHGGAVNLNATMNATDHLEFDAIEDLQWLDVDNQNGSAGVSRRLFVARVSRFKADYTFTARSFLRVIGQYVSTDRDPSLYLQSTTAHDGTFNGSALLAYKLNWQSVLFIGYGDDRALTDQRQLVKSDRQVFVKMSYAIQK